ncbi:hypothetical protein [Paraburkholderia sp. DHOC27]|uniref:hypothetical protein n=1 Tax=Paraburkholderia sp. DHOC27 TaxID=2303330 RepID=UPI0011C1B1BC|nr:hypothetical protein [Paraburkholderia sp. DHOC27]
MKFPLIYAASLLLASHCMPSCAGDIARDTPAASMALAANLYAAPPSSAAVSTVATPLVSATPLPPTTPPASVAASTPSLAAASAPLAPPADASATRSTTTDARTTEAGWTNYVAIICGVVGAIAGIAGAIMGGLGLRRANRLDRR